MKCGGDCGCKACAAERREEKTGRDLDHDQERGESGKHRRLAQRASARGGSRR